MNIYTHSGAAGDMVYSLAAAKRLGKGHFRFPNPRNASSSKQNMLPLIAEQPWFQGVLVGDIGEQHQVTDLDKFREIESGTLIGRNFKAWGLDEKDIYEPWLTVPDDKFLRQMKYSIYAYTGRYEAVDFDVEKYEWEIRQEELSEDNETMYFVGTDKEHSDIGSRRRHLATKNALELAQVVKGARTVFCNESLVLALARGLGHPDIRLVCADGYDHQLWHTPNETYLNR